MDAVQVELRNLKAAGIDAELKLKEYGAYISSTLLGKFEHMAVGLFGAWTDPDSYLYRYYMPGQPTNTGGVNDPKLTEMIRLQRRTFNIATRREIPYDIQRYLSQQVYYLYGPSVIAVTAGDQELRAELRPRLRRAPHGRLARPLRRPRSPARSRPFVEMPCNKVYDQSYCTRNWD